MIKNVFSGIGIALVCLFLYVTTRPSSFKYERSGIIQAGPEQIFPFISQFKQGDLWSPYEMKDPQMKKEFQGNDGQVGSKMIFEGNSDVGAGSLEITKITPNESVDIRLLMTEPMSADNKIHYQLTPTEEGTRFSWSMEGDGGFTYKLVSLFINCEQMVAEDMEKGITNLKTLVEAKEKL